MQQQQGRQLAGQKQQQQQQGRQLLWHLRAARRLWQRHQMQVLPPPVGHCSLSARENFPLLTNP